MGLPPDAAVWLASAATKPAAPKRPLDSIDRVKRFFGRTAVYSPRKA